MRELRGKTAVVTGGGSGIGRSLVLAFAREGMNVVIADIELANAEAVAAEAAALGVPTLAVRCDVADRESVAAMAARASNAFGGVQLLCNNAGIVPFAPIQDTTPANWDWAMAVNVDGPFNGVNAFLPALRAAGEAHIVNTASIAGLYALPGLAAYVASKFAVVGLSEALRVDLAPFNIGVSVLCPGGVRTNIMASTEHRQAAFGGPVSVPVEYRTAAAGADQMEPDDVAALVVRAVKENQFYVPTHPDTREPAAARTARVAAGYDWLG